MHQIITGKVFLIGAGPGDAELITLKAIKALQAVDVVLLDDLVSRDLLQHAPRARVIEVGKRGGCKSTPQHFINRMMVALAEQGQTVARLKGGDPFLFGRGGEEMLALRAAGIPVEIIPGITSGVAAPASIGIPITHREFTHGVTFVTGHTQNGDSPNWQALVDGGTTLVIYMGMKHISSIVNGLLAAGVPAIPVSGRRRFAGKATAKIVGHIGGMRTRHRSEQHRRQQKPTHRDTPLDHSEHAPIIAR